MWVSYRKRFSEQNKIGLYLNIPGSVNIKLKNKTSSHLCSNVVYKMKCQDCYRCSVGKGNNIWKTGYDSINMTEKNKNNRETWITISTLIIRVLLILSIIITNKMFYIFSNKTAHVYTNIVNYKVYTQHTRSNRTNN